MRRFIRRQEAFLFWAFEPGFTRLSAARCPLTGEILPVKPGPPPHHSWVNAVTDPRLADQYWGVLSAVFADVDRGVMRQVAMARGVERLLKIGENDERPAERIQRENAEALREMDELGNTRDAAWKVAGRRSKDPHTRLILAQRFRRARRRRPRRTKMKRAALG
jgi:hypothetical protein